MEAVSITMSSNTAYFTDRYFTQISRATIGSPDSGSALTDIYGAIHIDTKLIENAPIKPQNYKRYSDNTLDVCRNSSKEEQKQITDWINENISKDRIKFKVESVGDEVIFLDSQVNFMKIENNELEDNYILVPRMFSKETDTHQYPSRNSCHPNHIAKSIPITVAH